jgi:hypothetical protein
MGNFKLSKMIKVTDILSLGQEDILNKDGEIFFSYEGNICYIIDDGSGRTKSITFLQGSDPLPLLKRLVKDFGIKFIDTEYQNKYFTDCIINQKNINIKDYYENCMLSYGIKNN